jgi:hypothetical protein
MLPAKKSGFHNISQNGKKENKRDATLRAPSLLLLVRRENHTA